VTLWQQACGGVPADRLEAELSADAFRIYRPLAQWLEEGALQVVPSPEAIAAAKASASAEANAPAGAGADAAEVASEPSQGS